MVLPRFAAVALAALALGLSGPAMAFDVATMDAANSLPSSLIGSGGAPPRPAASIRGYAPSVTDPWNVPVAWSSFNRPGGAKGGSAGLVRGWSRNLPVDTDQWNVPLWFTEDPTNR